MPLEGPPEHHKSLPARGRSLKRTSQRKSKSKEKLNRHIKSLSPSEVITATTRSQGKLNRSRSTSKVRLAHPFLRLSRKKDEKIKLKRKASKRSLHQTPSLHKSREQVLTKEIKEEKEGKLGRFSVASHKSTNSRRMSKSVSATSGSSSQFSELDDNATFCKRLLYKKHFLTVSQLGAVFLGLLIGSILKTQYPPKLWTYRNISYVHFPAEIYYNIFAGLKTPLIVTSIIAGVGSLNLKTFQSMAIRTFIWVLGGYFLVVFVVSLLTLPVAQLLRDTYHRPTAIAPNLPSCNSTLINGATPCVPQSFFKPQDTVDYSCYTKEDQFMDLFTELLPPNLVTAFLQSMFTFSDLEKPTDPNRPTYQSCTDFLATPNHDDLSTFEVSEKWLESTNLNGLVLVALTAAVCSLFIGQPAQPFVDFFISLSEIHLKIGTWGLWISPIGLCSAVAANVLEQESPWNLSASVLWFLLYLTLLLITFTFIFLPILYYVFIRKLPFKFFLSLIPIIATAFGTGSSSATLPMTIYGLEQFSHLDPRVVRFGIPVLTQGSYVGAITVHSASFIYLVVTNGASLDVGSILSISTSIAIGQIHVARKIHWSEPTFLIASLAAQKFNTNYVISILPILWILDRVWTVLNVVSDCVCCAIVNHLVHRQLHELAERDEKALKEMELAAKNEQWDNGYTKQ